MNSVTLKPNVLTGDENEKKENLNKALRNKVCLDSNVLSKESAISFWSQRKGLKTTKTNLPFTNTFAIRLKNILVLARSTLLKSPKIATNWLL